MMNKIVKDMGNTVDASEDMSTLMGRHFGYELSDKKAKANLIKSANKEDLDFQEKQKCVMVDFSTGSYLELVIPTVKEWGDTKRKDKSASIVVENVTPGYDEKMKHIESIVRFFANSCKITVTCYNTTQRVKVEGRGYLEFVKSYLKPLFYAKLEEVTPGKIDHYNKEVIASLSGKRKARTRPTRSVRYKSMTKVPCPKCELSFMSDGQMRRHKSMMHTKCLNDTAGSIGNVPMVDNISLLEISYEEKKI